MRKRDDDEVYPNAAGIDVGASSHWVAVPRTADDQPVREFGTMTGDLHAMADWLLARGVDTVALDLRKVRRGKRTTGAQAHYRRPEPASVAGVSGTRRARVCDPALAWKRAQRSEDVVFGVVTQRTVASFTQRTFAHLQSMGARFQAKRETGAMVRDVQRGTDGIGFLLGVALFTIVPTIIEIGTVVAILLSGYAIGFVLIVVATFVAYGSYTFIMTGYRMKFQRAANRVEAQADSRLVDTLLNYETVKYFATETTETRSLSPVLGEWVNARTANQCALTLLHVGQSTIVAAGIAAVMLLAAQYVVAGGMSASDLVLVNAYMVQACTPLNTLGLVFRETNDALVNVERMFDNLLAQGHRGEDIDESSAQPLVVSAGEKKFENVEFGYEPARQIVVNVPFNAHRGRACRVGGRFIVRPVGSRLSYVAELPLSICL